MKLFTRRRTRQRGLMALASVIILLLAVGGGAAYAYFTGSGAGSGHATVANGDSAVTIATNAVSGSALLPGGTGDLVISATNPNALPVRITSLAIGSVTGCTTPSVSLSSPSSSYLPVTIPAHANAQRIDVAGALRMATSSSSDCQGKALTLSLSSVTVQQ